MQQSASNSFISKFIPILGEVSLDDYEERSRRGNLSIFWLFFTLTNFLTGLPYLFFGYTELGVPALSIAVISVLNLWYIEQGRDIRLSQGCAIVVLLPVSWYTLYLSQTTALSPIIILIYPLVFMFGLGIRLGLTCCAILFASALFALFVNLSNPATIKMDAYITINKIRLVVVLGSSIFFSWLAEFLRTHMQHRLIEMGKHIEEYALQDPLTSLGNRRSLERRLKQEKFRAHRERTNLGLCICDIDFSKKFNDQYGHECGDAALRHVAAIAQKTLRTEDSIFRWGGEEFVILLPNLRIGEEWHVLERVRQTIEQTPLIYEEKSLSITLSFGMLMYDFLLSDERNLEIADRRLYQAKHQGRNRVVWQESPLVKNSFPIAAPAP